MTFYDRASKSVNNIRILFNLDITQLHSQWVNAGAGVWYVNTEGLYPEVDPDLLTGFTSWTFPAIGSVLVDSTQLSEAISLLECSNNVETFYWDGTSLYIHPQGGDSPFIHIISIGVVFGFSREGFTPVGSRVYYQGRILDLPSISKSRDPLFWGKLQYEGGSVILNNGDGFFDLFGEENNIYGNQARIMAGFEDMEYSEYVRLFTGYAETLEINETSATISFADKRKQLSKKITYSCTNINALNAIQEILLDNYSIPYSSLYYNTTLWEEARTKAYNVTINITSAESTIDVIQKICESTFGIFQVDNDGKYAFRVIRPGDVATFAIPDADILNWPTARYDPGEVITSTKIGYAKDWTTTGSAYTYLNDTSQEADIWLKYKLYKEKTFDTMLVDLTAAQIFSNVILDYAGTIKAAIDIEVPIKYYNIDVGDFAEIEINRLNSIWFSIRKCEVVSKTFNLEGNTISLQVRKHGGEILYRITTDGYIRVTSTGEVRKVGT